MKKIGIITMAGGENFGAQLQNYAVMKTYESLGFEAVTIPDKTSGGVRKHYGNTKFTSKLKPSYMLEVLKVRTRTKFCLKNQRDRLIPNIINKKKNDRQFAVSAKARSKVFREFFEEHIKHTNYSISENNIPEDKLNEFDFFSAGSDQIWNPTYPSTSHVKFLYFADNTKKLTFAPSFGISELPSYVKEPYAKWLKEIPMISVREQRGAEIIKELTGKDATVICDPTLTVHRSDWESIEKSPDFAEDSPYALTYFLGNETNKYRRFVEKVAKSRKLKVINLFDIREPEFYSAGPAEFIYLIHHADAVFTDSFHAAVFSIIFKRNFAVFDRVENGASMGSRLKTLLETFSLSDRKYGIISEQDFFTTDFSNTDDKINELRSQAIEFLRNSIENNTKQ